MKTYSCPTFWSFALVGLLFLASQASADSPTFKLQDGDRVVILGNTLIEREQRTGYWEAALTARFPGKKILVRNLGWSGDTVFGQARAGFGSVADGFKHLKEHTLALKPTVLVIGYGTNESFEGAEGLPNFVKGLHTLLNAVLENKEAVKPRVVLLSPLRQENLGKPLPDPTEQNKNLRLYADAIRDVAQKREAFFVDLASLVPDGSATTPPTPLTDNGIHLTPWGYWRSAFSLEKGLGMPAPGWRVQIETAGKKNSGKGATPSRIEIADGRVSFTVVDESLPPAPAPMAGAPVKGGYRVERTLVVSGLAEGMYALTIDGKEIAKATAEQWQEGVQLERVPEQEQAEKLRATIVAKNELYFHRWRPQNETYLFGFRKHEQGKNAREIPQFDPLVAEKEAEIARLAVPLERKYELKRVEK